MTHVDDAARLLDQAKLAADGPVVFLTGAGISAESGIPTFRGEEGYWRVGSRNYHPMELATYQAFSEIPDAVWAWYLYRRGVCRAATPNPAHAAVAELERALADRFVLITQNVDGLHLRAGSSLERTFQIHGNIDFMRCARDCSVGIHPLPDAIPAAWDQGRELSDVDRAALVCPRCEGPSRPHVLWFDETYDEAHFRFESSIHTALTASLLVVVGTAGQTNLPLHIGALVAKRGAPMVVVNPEPSPFTEFAEQTPFGLFLRGTAGEHVPRLVAQITQHIS
jgi:NAD-dependent deacetylase